MRLTIIITLITVFQLTAKNTRGQKLTYSKDNTTISQIFKEIKRQTGYNVVWYEGKLNSHEPIDVNFYNTPLDKVMDNVLDGRAVTYQIIGKAIVIKAGEPAFRDKVTSTLATIDVRGRVLDDNNAPLVGAVVKVKGGTASTPTNSNGEFLLKNVDEDVTLVISYLGYQTREVKASKNVGNVKLTASSDKLEEVEINAGYYTVTDRERTGSIARITAETIEKQVISNPLQALQNRVAGLVITQNSGIPGGGFTVRVRGQNSFNTSGLNPLYIVDGVIYPSTRISSTSIAILSGGLEGASPLNFISPSDIESIEVLRDADATAIYGSRGGNGVILITTKKGIKGKLAVSASIAYGFTEVARFMDLLNTEEYISMRMEALKNDQLVPAASDYDVNGTWDKNKYTDWQKVMMGRQAPITNASTTISGGSENATYFLSGNYYKENTVFPGNFGFKRGGMHAGLTLGGASNKFNTVFSGTYTNSTTELPLSDPVTSSFLPPNKPDSYNENGELNWLTNNLNPMASLLRKSTANTDNLLGNVELTYKPVNGLVFKTSLSFNVIKRDELFKTPLNSYLPAPTLTNNERTANFANNFNKSWQIEPQLTYNTNILKGKTEFLLGGTIQGNELQYQNIRATGFVSDALMASIANASTLTNSEFAYTEYRYSAVFARINYNLENKFYINLTGRRDGSSRFGPGKQFANFGAVGLAYVFSEENFFKTNLPFISFGKFRASYGITGNDLITDYGFLDLWNSNGSYNNIPTLVPARLTNPDFAWEETRKAEMSLKLGFLQDKINLEVSWYRNNSSNQLLGLPTPLSTGFNSILFNLPATIRNTGFEIEGNAKFFKHHDWEWSMGFNLSIPKNVLTSFPGLQTSPYATTYVIGESLSLTKLNNVYVDPQTGLFIRKDWDNNGLINDLDRYIFANPRQRFYGGIQSSLRYKHFSFDFLISFTNQIGTIINGSGGMQPGGFSVGSNSGNQLSSVLQRWQNPGEQANFQKFTTLSNGFSSFNFLRLSDRNFGDASYARLKNVALSFDLPQSWLSQLKIRSCQLNLQGQNLFTFTNYKGLDPETQSSSNLPTLRSVALGLKITF